MREKILGLRNLNYDLELFNSKKRFAVYKNDEHNNIIIYSYDKGCSVDSVSGAIRDKAYLYLIYELNTNNNILVDWRQVEGTTSDYDIYYDINYDEVLKQITDKTIDKYLETLIKENNAPSYKYRKIKNGVMDKLTETVEL
jgi:hypothetical protein